jgi:hypothetical protein
MAMLALLDAAEFGAVKVRPAWDRLSTPAKREIIKLLFDDIRIGKTLHTLSRWSTAEDRLTAATARIKVTWRKPGRLPRGPPAGEVGQSPRPRPTPPPDQHGTAGLSWDCRIGPATPLRLGCGRWPAPVGRLAAAVVRRLGRAEHVGQPHPSLDRQGACSTVASGAAWCPGRAPPRTIAS